MIILQDSRSLIRALSAVGHRLIAIDGWYGSGKSRLGRSAAFCMGRPWVDLDRLLQREQNTFVDHLDLQALLAATQRDPPVILSGVCMKEALARVGSPPAIHVYLKRMHLGYWTDEEEAKGRGLEMDEAFPPSALAREVRAYHQAWEPHLKADYVYERSVNGGGL